MTKNSSSKAAIAQIRTRLSAVGIEMNYSTALRLYDAAGEGPRRITKAMAIGIDRPIAPRAWAERSRGDARRGNGKSRSQAWAAASHARWLTR